MGTIGDFRAKFAAAHLKAVNEAEYTASIDGLDLEFINQKSVSCLLYTSPSPRDS